MVLVLMGLLDDINAAKSKSDIASRLSISQTAGGAIPRSGNKRPTNAGTGYVHSTWHGTSSSTSAPGKGVHPLLETNLSESGCPQTAPQIARGATYAVTLGRTQATTPYQTPQAGQVLYNPNNPQMARLQMAHGNMGYQQSYQQPAPTMYQPQFVQPIQAQGQPVQQQQQMQQPVYTPPQTFVHPDNTKPAQQPASTPAQPTLIPTPVETFIAAKTQPVSTGTVETPPEIEAAPGSGGFFWMFSSLIPLVLLGSIAAIIWYCYQKAYGKRHSRRAPRRWETIRAKVMQNHYVQDQLRSTNGDLEGGYTGRPGRQHSVDNQVPLVSRHPSLIERISKGSKLG